MADFAFPVQNDPSSPMAFEPATPGKQATPIVKREQDILREVLAGDKENMARPVSCMPNAATPVTPDVFKKPIRVVQTSRPHDDLPQMVDLISWNNPPAAFCALVGGACFLCAAHWFFSTETPFLSGATSFMGCMLALNFFRSVFSATWLKESTWSGSAFETVLIARSKDFISFVMLARDQFLCSDSPWVTLGSCVALACVRTLSFYVGFWMMAAVGWVALFVLYPLRHSVSSVARDGYASVTKGVQTTLAKLKMARMTKLMWSAVAVVLAMALSDYTTRAFLILAFLMFCRCTMKKEEVKALQAHHVVRTIADNKLLRSAYKAREKMGAFADDVLMSAMKSARRQIEHLHEN